jgi:hypothetical protein
MFVLVTTAGVTLEEPDDLGRFHVALDPGVADLDAALRVAGWGQAQGDGDASISVEALRTAAAAAPVEPGWDARFDAMVDYARSKGWLSADGRAIQAHVEPAS